MSGDPLHVIETQMAILMRLGEATRRATELKPHRALDRAAYVILRVLQEEGPLNVTAVAERLNLDGSTVTRQVAALHRDALVDRDPDPTDGRGSVITMTAAGRAQVEAVSAARQALYGKVLGDWSERDRADLADTLTRFSDAIDRYVRTPRR